MIDTHCHLTFPDYEGRVDTVLQDARADGVRAAICVGTTAAESAKAARLTEQHPGLFFSAGVHPLYAHKGEPGVGRDGDFGHPWDVIATLADHPNCVAWGELGLDKYYPDPPLAIQLPVLERQLDVIRNHPKSPGVGGHPVILHCREAYADLIEVLKQSGLPADRFVFHCFTSTPEDLELCLDFGAHVSFTGVLTFASAHSVREAAALVPLDRVMVETDAPFMTPKPHRKVKPCEPKHVVHTAAALAQVHNLSVEDMEQILDQNAMRFFSLTPRPEFGR